MVQRLRSLLATFRFPAFANAGEEQAFWVKFDQRRLEFRKFFIFCAIIAFTALGILDFLLSADAMPILLTIRAATVVIISAIFHQFCQPNSTQAREYLITAFGLVIVSSFVLMALVGPKEVGDAYTTLIAVALIYGSCLLVPRFSTQLIFCVATNLIYWPSTIVMDFTVHQSFTNLFAILLTTLRGCESSLNAKAH